jgi:hypothetical protein
MSATTLPLSLVRDLDPHRHPRIAARIRRLRREARRLRREADRLHGLGQSREADAYEADAYAADRDADALLERFV